MIKDCNMEYRPGKRHWYKLKRDYLDGMADTLDLVLLGVCANVNARANANANADGGDRRVYGQRKQGRFGFVVPDGMFGSRDADLADRVQGQPFLSPPPL